MTLFLDALAGKNSGSRPPIWIMRQAGRYAPSYQAIKKEHSLNEMFRTPALIEKITCLPLTDLDVDAAILFADILHIPLTMGIDVNFPKGGGIEIEPLIEKSSDFQERYPLEHPAKALDFVFTAIRNLKKRIDKPLIGFAGGPFTVASYLFKDKAIKKWMVKEPGKVHFLLQTVCDQTILYLQEQVSRGVDAIQIFESWASLLTRDEFKVFVMPYLKQIFKSLQGVPTIFFSRSTHNFLDQIITLKPSCISFDEFLDISIINKQVPASIAIQGNLNPYLLHGSPDQIRDGVESMLASMADSSRYIVNLGHGVMPDIPFENVKLFVDAVKSYSSVAPTR